MISTRQLEPVYDIETIIDAVPRIRESLHEATLTVAGDGSLRSRLTAMALAKNPETAVRFVGEVAHEKMPDLLREHDVYLSMSRSDTTSVSLLEAMACGLFPIVSDIPANREWIDHKVNGLLVPLGDAPALARCIREAWADEPRRSSARQHNQQIIKSRADWRQNMAKAREVFDRIIADSPGRSSARTPS